MQKKDDFLRVYMESLPDVSLLNFAEEAELSKKSKAGDEKARHKLVEANLSLVVFFAKKYKRKYSTFSLLELIQAGNIGLVDAAAGGFKEELGFRFATYAGKAISRAIYSYILTAFSYNDETFSLDFSARRVDAPLLYFIEDGKSPSPLNGTEKACLRALVRDVLSELEPAERQILSMSVGLDDGITHTKMEIAEKLKMTKERVRQIMEKSFRRLRRHKKLGRFKSLSEV